MTTLERKARLFACACVREIEHLLMDPISDVAIEAAERFTNGHETEEELQEAEQKATEAAGVIAKQFPGNGRAVAAEAAAWTAAKNAAQAEAEASKLAARAAASEATA